MVSLALIARGVFVVTALIIVGSGVAAAWASGQFLLAIAALVAFPITYFVFPWIGGLGWVFLVSLIAYAVSSALDMEPFD
jgi:hypothetical protein